MSRTKKTGGSSSPVQKYLSFKGSKGQVRYYDKNKEGEDKNVNIDTLDLVILDIKSSVSGFNESSSSSISSNMLDPYSTGKEEFIVKTKVNGSFGEFTRGIWKDIKDEVANIGGKFTTNIFALADVGDGNGLQIVRLELNGSALSPWIEYVDGLDNDDEVYDQLITITKGQLCTRKKGKTVPVSDAEYKKVVAALKKDPMADKPVWFYAPEFTGQPLTEDLTDLAVQEDERLQEYFDSVGVKTEDKEEPSSEPSSTATAPAPAANTEEDDDDDLPF